MKKHDTIIIGSGVGGLTSGALLSKKFNKKVLVLEQHSIIGGLTHEFKRIVDGVPYKWSVGLHYVGDMAKGSLTRKLFDYITDGNLEWEKMTDRFDNFIYPDLKLSEKSKPKAYKQDIINLFPEEEKAINNYFKHIKRASSWYIRDVFINFLPKWMSIWLKIINSTIKNIALSTTQQYLDSHFKSEKLKALLTSQWGDYGLPPQDSSFAIHALVIQNYLKGAYFPVGGSEQLAKTIVPVITKNGGDCLTNHTVKEIIIENGKAIGVKVLFKKRSKLIEKEFFAEQIISNVGAINTYTKLLPESNQHSKLNEIKSFPKGYSAVTLYIALKDSPKKLGFLGENYWVYDGYNHNEALNDTNSFVKGKIRYAFLSFPSLKNIKAKGHTAEILTILPYHVFDKWKNSDWMNRGEDYDVLKAKITESYLNLIESKFKGFKDLVAYTELSTPLSVEHFTLRKNGEMYGIPAIPKRHTVDWLKPKTEIKNLYLTGTDICSLGIQGALYGGLATSSTVNGQFGLLKILSALKP